MNLPTRHSTLLALDTSGPACSVAVQHGGAASQAYEIEAQQHTRELLPLIDKLLQKNGLEKTAIQGIILSAGPGAFTGLRIGAAVATGLATAWDVPLLPISSLALLAATIRRHSGAEKILAVMDARMGEVYEEAYMNGYNWDAFLNAYLAANAPELLDGLDADPEGSAYFATYPLTPEYRQKAEKFKQVIVDLIENDSKIFAFLEKHGGEIEWD